MERRKALILVVDDDPDLRELLRHELARGGYEVAMAADAPAAHELIHARRPDLIVSDISMPGASGIELIAALREDAALAKIPVIYLTGLEEDAELAVQTVGYPVLSKPFRAPELLRLVRTQLPSRA